MKKMKKMLVSLLLIALLVSLSPTYVFAESPEDGAAVDVIFMVDGVQYARESVKTGASLFNWPETPSVPDGMVTEDGDDYEFAGWADNDGNLYTRESVFTETTTLTAQWKAPEWFTVTFQDRYGNLLSSSTLIHGSKLSDYEGYAQYADDPAFVGWFAGTAQLAESQEITEDVTVHAVFRVTVTFVDKEGNTIASDVQNSGTALSGFNGFDRYASDDEFVTWLNEKEYYSGEIEVYEDITVSPLFRKIQTDCPVYIGNTGYSILQEAFDAAEDGDTIDLVEDIEIEGTTLAPDSLMSITLNLNEKTITNTSSSKYAIDITKPVNLTIIGNGSIISNDDDCIDVEEEAAGTSLVIDGLTLKSNYFGIYVYSGDKTKKRNSLRIKNADISTYDDESLYVGSYTDVVIDGGLFESNNYCALYSEDDSSVVINGGTFKSIGDCAVDINEGNADINGGSFYSKENCALYTYGNITVNGGVFRTDAYDKAAFQCNDNKVTINGGEFYSVAENSAAVCQTGAYMLVINGGIFNAPQYYAIKAENSVEIHAGTFTGGKGGLIARGGITTLYGGTFASTDGRSPALVNGGSVDLIKIADGYVATPENWKNSPRVTVLKDGTLPEEHTVTFMDAEGKVLSGIQVKKETVVGDIADFEYYKEDDTFLFWKDQYDNIITAQSTVESDLILSPVFESADSLTVHSTDELIEKLADPTVTTIILGEPENEDSYNVRETIQINHSVTILGNNITLKREKSCTDAVFQVVDKPTDAVLDGMIIDGNQVESQRAAVIALNGSRLTLKNVTIENCINIADGAVNFEADRPKPIMGGAISACGKYANHRIVDKTSITIDSCVLKNNRAVNGGAISLYNDVNLIIQNTDILGNKADKYGGALYTDKGLHTGDTEIKSNYKLMNTRIYQNTAIAGGGIYLDDYSPWILTTTNVKVYNNTACQGGGLWAGHTFFRKSFNDFTGTDFFGNRANESFGTSTDMEKYIVDKTEGVMGDDVFDINRALSMRGSNRKYKNPLSSEKSGNIEKESRANATVPFTDENGNSEEIPENVLIPFHSWFEDGDYRLNARYENMVKSIKIPDEDEENDYKLDPAKINNQSWPRAINGRLFYGMKSIYFGYLVKYMPNHPEYANEDVQQYDETAYLPDSTVLVKDNDGFTDYSWAGHVFEGWNTEADGTGEWFDSRFQIKENTILYAIWEKVPGGSLTVSKEVSGQGDKKKAFSFVVSLSDTALNGTFGEMEFVNGVAEFTLKDGQSKTASDLPAGILYTVKEEDNSGYTTTVNQINSEILKGKVIAGNGWEVHFINEIPIPDDPKPAKVNLTAGKTLNGSVPSRNDFTFILKDRDGNILQTVNNVAGNISFAEMVFDKEGVYEYTISEQTDTDKSINYDNTVYTVTIKVTRNDDYTAEITYEKNGQAYSGTPMFANTSKPGIPVTPVNPLPPEEHLTDPEDPTEPVQPEGKPLPGDNYLENKEQVDSNVPKTGDAGANMILFNLLLMTVSALTGITLYLRKTAKKK